MRRSILLFVPVIASCTPLRYAVRVETSPPLSIDANHYDFEIVTRALRGPKPVSGVVFVQELDLDMIGYSGDEVVVRLHSHTRELGATYEGGDAHDEQAYDPREQSVLPIDRTVVHVRGRLLRTRRFHTRDVDRLREISQRPDDTGIFSTQRTAVAGTGAHAAFVRAALAKNPLSAFDVEIAGFEKAFDGAEPVMTFEYESDQRVDGAHPQHAFNLTFVPAPKVIVPAPRHDRF